MPDLFKDIINSILVSKKNVLTIEEDESSYVPFIVNKAMAQHVDTVLLGNEMNLNSHLDKKLQYDFLLNIVRSWKRPFQKWNKNERLEVVELIKEYYRYSNEKAKQALLLLSDDQINEIRKRLEKGGLKNDKLRRSSMGETKES